MILTRIFEAVFAPFLLSPNAVCSLHKQIMGETKALSNMSRLASWQTISDEIQSLRSLTVRSSQPISHC
jgi:hypothetical protein